MIRSILSNQKFVNKAIASAAVLNSKMFISGVTEDSNALAIKARKDEKQGYWLKKSTMKLGEPTDLPKISGTNRITILATRVEKKEMFRTSDGDMMTRDVPPGKSLGMTPR